MKQNSTIPYAVFKNYLDLIPAFLRVFRKKSNLNTKFFTNGIKAFLICLSCWMIPSKAKADTPIPTSVVSNYDPVTHRLTLTVKWSWGSSASTKIVTAAVFADLNGDGISPLHLDNPATYNSGGNTFPAGLSARDEFLGQLAISTIEGTASSTLYPAGDRTDNGIAAQNGFGPADPRVLFPYGTRGVGAVGDSGTFTLTYDNVLVAPSRICVILYDVHAGDLNNTSGGHSPRSANPGVNSDNSYDDGNGQGTVSCVGLVVLRCAMNKTETACQSQATINSSYSAWISSVTASGCNGVLTNNSTGAPSASGGSKTVTFTYTQSSCSNQAAVTTCTATYTVLSCNTAPAYNPDINVTYVHVPVPGNVQTNDVVPGGTTYGTPVPLAGNPPSGSITMNTNGTYSFVSPNVGVYRYHVPVCVPGQAAPCPTTLLTITVLGPNVSNNPPVANTDIATTRVNTPVTLRSLSNDRAGNPGGSLNPGSVTITVNPLHGTAVVNTATGDITYTPANGYTGRDTLTYRVCDNSTPTALCATALQIITINAGGTPNSTSAADDYVFTPINTSVTGNAMTNDTDPEGNAQTITAQTTTVPGKGTLVLNSNGTFTFTPVTGFSGPVNFPYTTTDNGAPTASANATIYVLVSPGSAPPPPCLVGGINMGDVSNYLFVFTNGSGDANWQSSSKGYIGNVALDGIQATEKTSGSLAYAGTITTNASSLGAWQTIVNNNAGQAFASLNQTATLTGLENDLNNVFTQVNALAVTSGYNGIAPTALNGLNKQNGIAETIVINVNSGFNVSSKINITGDASDVFILRWDTDMNAANGYQGQVKFQSGGAIVPMGGLTAANFIHVAGDIDASGGGTNPAAPYPQGPRTNNGTGTLINGGSDFNGGGFFTGYWFTTGDPVTGKTSSLSNAIFVGGWYSTTTKFSMTSGTSGVYVEPVCYPSTLQLGDKVFFDMNNNGFYDASENGIENVTVNLYKDNNNDNVADGAPIATTITDSNGNYLFTNLSLGNYIVGVVRPNGYVSSNINGGDPDNNIDNDDNGQVVIGMEVRGLAITLAAGTEPTGGNTNNTYDFGLLPDCSCPNSPGNLIKNGSFENGTTGWNWSGANGLLTTGTCMGACGVKVGFNNQISGTSNVWQDIAVSAGVMVRFSGFAGVYTAGLNCSPKLSLIFLNSANTIIGQTDVAVTRDVDVNYGQLEQYFINEVSPAGTVKVRVQSSIDCNTLLLDAFCLIAPVGGPLAVIMSEFTATKKSCTANLNWKTSSEIKADRFEVEVSTNNSLVYTMAGTVIASGNSSTTRTYSYIYMMQPGITYLFRLKMIDKDGAFKYSDVRSLNCTDVKGIEIAPNPAVNQFMITGMEKGKNIVAIYNASGQWMKTQVITQNYGTVNIVNLEPGFYTVKITAETGNTEIKRIIKY